MESEAKILQAIFDHAALGIAQISLDGSWLRVNDRYCQMLGYSETELRNRKIWDITRPTDFDEVSAGRRQLLEGTISSHSMEKRFIRKDGTVFWGRLNRSLVRNHDNLPQYFIAVVEDITEQVKARELLRQSEWHLKNAARLAHIGYWQWDIKANQVSGSDEMFRIFGKPANYTPSYDDFLQTVIPEEREQVTRWVGDCLAEKRGSEIEYQIAWPNGEVRAVSCISELSLGEEGLPTRMFGACQDITDFRRAQRENLARQKLESIGTLAGGIAHDFNNLLAGVLAEAELAGAELEQGESPLEGLKRIRLAAGRGAEIVRELMTYSGQDKAGPVEPIDLSQLVEEILGLLKISVSKHAVLKVDLQKRVPTVLGNSAQLRQVVMNLVINASEALGEEDGLIGVATSHIVLPRSSGPDLPAGDYLNLEVSDTGSGMSEELQAKVFDPFFSTKFAGRGLGLAVVHGIVRDHGGAINLVSAPGQGTKFEILLPCGGETAQSQHDATEQATAKARGNRAGTILVVEDEAVLRGAVSKMLRKNGFSVLEAMDGSSALELVRAHYHEIDVMLLDITLPGVSSLEVFEHAKRLRPELKVILTSAYGREAVDAAFAGLRGERFIRKPFRFVELMSLLQDALAEYVGAEPLDSSQ